MAQRAPDDIDRATRAADTQVTAPQPQPGDRRLHRAFTAMRRCLADGELKRGDLPRAWRRDTAARTVFLSLSDGRNSARIVRGHGAGIHAALVNALAAARSKGLGPRQAVWLKLDVVESVGPALAVKRGHPLDLARSLDGLALDRACRVAILPEGVLARQLLDRHGGPRIGSLQSLLRRHGHPDVDLKRTFRRGDLVLYPFRTRSFFASAARAYPLLRGHEQPPRVDRETVHEAIAQGAAYLRANQRADGSFEYLAFSVNPPEGTYNLPRHAGAICALVEAAEFLDEPGYLEAAREALAYLHGQARPLTLDGRTLAVLPLNGQVKIESMSLALLALVKYQAATGERPHGDWDEQLAEYLAGCQDDAGRFTTIRLHPDGTAPGHFSSPYGPGEAILALTGLYALDENRRWLEAAERGASFLIVHRDGDRDDAHLEHDHWLLYALQALTAFRDDPRYVGHGRRLANAIVAAQRRAHAIPDWRGSFYDPPRSTPTATRMEGLTAALAFLRGHAPRRELRAIRKALDLGTAFQFCTRLGPAKAMYFPDPARALGGFHGSLDDVEVRIDYVQHNLSALIRYYRLRFGDR